MPLDPQIEALLARIEQKAYPDLSEFPLAEARAIFAKTSLALDAPPEPVFRVADTSLPGPAGALPVRIYTPRASAEPLPLLLWLHGGGFVIGGLDTADPVCRQLAKLADCIVVSLAYRLAPEHKFPAAVEDAYAALAWLTAHGDAFGGDARRLAIGGDSAGANLAAVATILARDAGLPLPRLQLLAYPGIAPEPDSASQHAFAEGYFLTRRSILWFYDHYLSSPADSRDFRYAPLLAPDLSGLPPTLLIVAGHDPLRDEDLAYAERLRAAGNALELVVYDGMTHGFLTMAGAVPAAREAIVQAATVLRQHLAPA